MAYIRLEFKCVFRLSLLILASGMLASIALGPMSLSFAQVLLSINDALLATQLSSLEDYQRLVVIDLRIPRMLLAVFVGTLLAQSGVVMQGLFRNPLADPGIIGVSSGAALGAILAIVLVPQAFAAIVVPSGAFLGGLASTLLVYALARTRTGTSVLILLLSGIAIAAFCGAVIGFLSYFSDEQALRDLVLWQMGSLASSSYIEVAISALTAAVLAWQYQRSCNALDALQLGESAARHLGINVERLKFKLIILCAIGVGVAVASAGIIAFIGLVIPHIARMMLGPAHKQVLLLSAVAGAILLVYADVLARLLLSPAELPVGLICALIGAPFFLYLLLKQRASSHYES